MKAVRVGLIGARRARQGLGPFVARSLCRAGATVPCFVGTRSETIAAAEKELLGTYGISARGYLDLDRMLAEQHLDALAILSPAETHAGYLEAAAAAGLHVLCEKPLIWGGESVADRAAAVLERFAERHLLIQENCQWPCTLRAFQALHPGALEAPISRFGMRLSPASTGLEALRDSISHPLSLLQALIPSESPRIESPRFERPNAGALRVRFDYCVDEGRTEVAIDLVQSRQVPREAAFSVNGKTARRRVRIEDYAQSFEDQGRTVTLGDPLEQWTSEFARRLEAVRAGRSPGGTVEIGLRMRMIERLAEAFRQQGGTGDPPDS